MVGYHASHVGGSSSSPSQKTPKQSKRLQMGKEDTNAGVSGIVMIGYGVSHASKDEVDELNQCLILSISH